MHVCSPQCSFIGGCPVLPAGGGPGAGPLDGAAVGTGAGGMVAGAGPGGGIRKVVPGMRCCCVVAHGARGTVAGAGPLDAAAWGLPTTHGGAAAAVLGTWAARAAACAACVSARLGGGGWTGCQGRAFAFASSCIHAPTNDVDCAAAFCCICPTIACI